MSAEKKPGALGGTQPGMVGGTNTFSMPHSPASVNGSGARELTRQFHGEWCGTHGRVPGPGHSSRDRSLKIWDTPNGVRVHSFCGDDWQECRRYLGLDDERWRRTEYRGAPPARQEAAPQPRGLPARVRDIMRTVCHVDLVPDAVAYLDSRRLWPLPPNCALRAHSAIEYWSSADGPPHVIGRFPALVASVRDVAGKAITLHLTYLHGGRKVAPHAPRKILSGTVDHTGCACRLMPVDGTELGIAEGIETALAAHRMHGGPVWAALNAGMMAKFQPPAGISRVIIYADADAAGLKAAWELRDRQREIEMELRMPPRGCKDWADALMEGRHV